MTSSPGLRIFLKAEQWSGRADSNSSRFAGANKPSGEREPAGEILSAAKDRRLEIGRGERI